MYIFICKEINKFTVILPDFPKKSAKLVCVIVAHEYAKEIIFNSSRIALPCVIRKIEHSEHNLDANIALGFVLCYICHLSLCLAL